MKQIILVFCTILFSFQLSAQLDETTEKVYRDSIQSLTQKIEELKAFPSAVADYYLKRADLYLKLSAYDKALKDCEIGLGQEVMEDVFYNIQGQVYFKMNSFIKMTESYTNAIKHNPESYYYLRRGEAYYYLRAPSFAERDIDKYLIDNLEISEGVHILYGMVLTDLGKYLEAMKAFKKANEINQNNVVLQMKLGKLYEEMNMSKVAIDAYAKAHNLAPESHGKDAICLIYHLKNKEDSAAIYCDWEEYSMKKQAELYGTLASKLLDEDEYERALVIVNKAISMDNTNVDFYNIRGLIYIRMENFEAAKKDYEQAERLTAVNPYILENNRGYLNMMQGKYEEAIIEFEKCIEVQPYFPNAHNNKALCHLELKQLDEAKKYARNAKILHETNEYIYFTYAGIAAYEGNDKAFYKQLKTAVKKGFPLQYFDYFSFLDTYKSDSKYQKLLEQSKEKNKI